MAVQRVRTRVQEGGHNIPEDAIVRRFTSGLQNLFRLYIPVVDKWILIDNSGQHFEFIAEGSSDETVVKNEQIWLSLKSRYYGS